MKKRIWRFSAVIFALTFSLAALSGCVKLPYYSGVYEITPEPVTDSDLSEETPAPTPSPTEIVIPEVSALTDTDVILRAAEEAAEETYAGSISDYAFLLNRPLVKLYVDSDDKKEMLLGMYEAMLTSEEEYRFADDTAFDKNELNFIMNLLDAEAPEILHVESEYKYYIADERITGVAFGYSMSPSEYCEKLTELFSVCNEVKSAAADMTDYEAELYAAERIMDRCIYKSDDYCSTAYGALINGKAICDGYSDAFTLLMHVCGIECFQIWGEAKNAKGKTESHAWNKVKIGNDWYNVDVTWDDPKDDKVCLYSYFNTTDEEILRNHTVSDVFETFALPECTATEYNCLRRIGVFIGDGADYESYITDKIDELISDGKDEGGFYMRFESGNDFSDFRRRIDDIIETWTHDRDNLKSLEYTYIYDDVMRAVYFSVKAERR